MDLPLVDLRMANASDIAAASGVRDFRVPTRMVFSSYAL